MLNHLITAKDTLYFNLAKAVAKLSHHEKHRIGSVLVKGNDILAVGFNTLKSHPVQMRYNAYRNMKGKAFNNHSLHSEIACILKVKNKTKLKGAILYSIRIRRNGTVGIAKPCPACYNFIKDETPICDVYYSAESDYAYTQINRG